MIYRKLTCGCGGDCCNNKLQGENGFLGDILGSIGGIFGSSGSGPTTGGCTLSCNLSFLNDQAARQACLNNCISQVGNQQQQFMPGMGQGIDLTTIAIIGIGGLIAYKLISKK
jgi:hypothetical protein